MDVPSPDGYYPVQEQKHGVYKKIFFIGLFICYLFACFFVFPKVVNILVSGESEQIQNQVFSLGNILPQQSPTPTPTIVSNLTPVTLFIPKIGVRAPIERVGQTKTHNMDVPKNAAHAAWYLYGSKPSEQGNAVINGHYDTPSGAPAVFYRLKDLEIGDEVQTISEEGNTFTFIVTAKEIHPYESFPNEFVFHTRPGKNLNLITCDGIWDPLTSIYNDRLVIFTTLKEG